MRPALILAAVLPFTTAAIIPRSAATIVKAVNNINANIKIVNTTLNTFKQGSLTGIATVLKIQQQTQTLGDAVDNATTIAKASNKLTDQGSNTVATVVLTLPDTIKSLTDNLIAHKPAFDSVFIGIGSASPQVRKDLIAQQQGALALGKAITAKLSPLYAGVAPSIIAQINSTFTEAIAAFNNTGGKLPVPPIFPTV